ncbi:N-acylglucosamine 2-epimerase [Roseiconus nitratireducens]|uniref:N-acylglucosamine 2-epimerase n=1 Tax=Roseiconus nitratireducens TaxID=2605748 RepID=A0A5M6D2L1_9BACT|nr:AGE family epimerase/isomerase [Roseiconus nitratireducens]KAA5540532.1 N-acylglucosamine 2-epimerase [Roseiconus nitratireducens]
MNDATQRQLADAYRDALLEDTLPFWLQHGVDHKFGGVITSLDAAGNVIDTDKGVWQQCRFAWLLGELHNNLKADETWLRVAQRCMDFVDRNCFDPLDGRLWFQVTRTGEPLRKRRYAFSESFAAIAYGELAQATGDDLAAQKAERLFRRFLNHHLFSPEAKSKFTETRPMRSLGFPMIGIATAQQLRDSINYPGADDCIDRLIDLIRRFHIREDLEVVLENVGVDGQVLDHFDGRLLNPGHAIECSWFLMQEGQHRGDRDLQQLGCRMLDWMWQRGWDDDHGGLFSFVDLSGKPVSEYWHDMKFWWPHCEAVIATLMAYQLTGDARYARWYRQVHDWAHDHFADPERGEWFGYLHHDGTVSSQLKGNLWKGPFHLPRMQLICSQLLGDRR